jgi:hypothetical protein
MARPESDLKGKHRVEIPDSGWGIAGDFWLKKKLWDERQAKDLEALLLKTLELFCQVWGR